MIPGNTILVIDTDRGMMQNIISILESADYLVFTASSKSDGMTVAKKVNPSLIYINIGMTGASGLDISKTFHDEEPLSKIPIVILTPHGGTVEPRYTSIYGIVDFLKTSFTPEELIEKTREILSGTFFVEEPPEDVSVTKDMGDESVQRTEEREQITAIPVEEEITQVPAEEIGAEKLIDEKLASETTGTDELDFEIPEEVTSDRQPSGTKMPPRDMPLFEHAEEIAAAEELREAEQIKGMAESKKKKMSLIPYLLIVFVILGAAGTFLFWNVWHASQVEVPVPVQIKPSVTEPQEVPPAQVQPSLEQQKPQTIEVKKPALPSKPAQAKKLPVAPVEKPGYAIQVGVFKNKQNALSILKKFQDKGYKARLHTSEKSGNGMLYRVLIGTFSSKEEAAKQASTIKSKENIDVMIFHKIASK